MWRWWQPTLTIPSRCGGPGCSPIERCVTAFRYCGCPSGSVAIRRSSVTGRSSRSWAPQFAALPSLSHADVLVSASPSFPALFPAIVNARVRQTPWIIWLHDILPDGAASSGIVDESSLVIRGARRLEQAAYREADRIVVLSEAFTHNLTAKGVPEAKIQLIYDPATRVPRRAPSFEDPAQPPRLLSMGQHRLLPGLGAAGRGL
jgi:hypothetical protein